MMRTEYLARDDIVPSKRCHTERTEYTDRDELEWTEYPGNV